jgi:metallo-beta-lactamase class B
MFFCSMMVGGNPLMHNTTYPTIVEDFRSSFAKARRLNPDVFLANHANQFDLFSKMARRAPGKPNPFIDPSEYHRFLAEVKKGFDEELAKQQSGAGPTLP